MLALRTMRLFACALASAITTAGCTLATASSGFEEAGPRVLCGSDGDVRDFVLALSSFSAHGTHTLRGDVVHVEGTTRTLVGRFVLDPGQITSPSVTMACLLDAGETYELDLVADVPGTSGMPNGVVDCPPLDPPRPECTDHQWRLSIPASGELSYMHALDFRDISVNPPGTGANRVMDVQLLNLGSFAGEPLEVHVRRCDGASCAAGTRRTVYLHRLGAIPAAPAGDDFMLPRAGTIAAIDNLLATPGANYEIAFWVDSNRDGRYQPSSAARLRDVSWRTELNTDVLGLHAVFDATSTEAVFVDVGL